MSAKNIDEIHTLSTGPGELVPGPVQGHSQGGYALPAAPAAYSGRLCLLLVVMHEDLGHFGTGKLLRQVLAACQQLPHPGAGVAGTRRAPAGGVCPSRSGRDPHALLPARGTGVLSKLPGPLVAHIPLDCDPARALAPVRRARLTMCEFRLYS